MDEALDAVILAGADEDEVEQVILHNIFGVVENIPDMAAENAFNLDNMNAQDVKTNLRFERDDIYRLADALRLPQIIRTQTRNSVTGVVGLCILLRRLVYPGRLKDLQVLFGLSPQSLSQIINHMQSIIGNNFIHLLDDLRNLPWLNLQRMQLYAEAIHDRGAAVPNCWGFIDGTARPICRPSINQEQYYSGHKRFHCLKYQSVLCPDGMIVSFKGAYMGRRHDAGIFRESNLYAELQDIAVFPNNQQFVLYGDHAYPIMDLLLCPFPNRQGIPIYQQHFNESMSAVRVAVEWGFQKVVTQFAFVDFKKNQKLLLQDLQSMLKVSIILNNCHTTLYGSQTSQFFHVVPPTLEEYLENQ